MKKKQQVLLLEIYIKNKPRADYAQRWIRKHKIKFKL